MTYAAELTKNNASVGLDLQPCRCANVSCKAGPCPWADLQRSTHQIPDDVPVAYHHLGSDAVVTVVVVVVAVVAVVVVVVVDEIDQSLRENVVGFRKSRQPAEVQANAIFSRDSATIIIERLV